MVDKPKEQDQIDMVLWNLQPIFVRLFVGISFQNLKSFVQATFSIGEGIAQGLWTYTTLSLNSKGKKPIRSSSRSREIGIISYKYQRPTHHLHHRSSRVRVSHP